MLKRDVALVVLVLLIATTMAGCAQLTDIVNGRSERPPLMPILTPTTAPANTPATTPDSTPTPTPVPASSPSPTPSMTATASPSPSPTPSPTPTPTPTPAYQNDTRITAGVTVMQPFGIWDHYIVYDEKAGNDEFYLVHLYDISNGADTVVASGNVRSYGCIGGEAGNGKVGLIYGDIYRIALYDINSGVSAQIIGGGSLPYKSPCIDGRHLMYVNDNDPQNPAFIYIYDYDIVAKTKEHIMAAPDPNELRQSGDNIVWWSRNGDLKRIGLIRNGLDGGFAFISPSDMVCDHPRISGNTIVYHCTANGAGYINAYNVDTSTTERVTHAGSQSSCDISGSRIVYDDNRDGNWNIYMTDHATGSEVRLTDEPHDQTSPVIWGDYVAYLDNRNGSPDLYLLSLEG